MLDKFNRKFLKKLRNIRRPFMSRQSIFEEIYKEGYWSSENNKTQYYSGDGSHNENLYGPYVRAVEELIKSRFNRPNVVDLGCGDFNIGSKIRPFCGNYMACDISKEIIEKNKNNYSSLGVNFQNLCVIDDPLPSAEIGFIRQVLQHLSNSDIMIFLNKLENKYKYIVVTEHLPDDNSFIPNLDHPTGKHTRLRISSGVIITESPFNMVFSNEEKLCEVRDINGGRLLTTLYTNF